MGDNFVKIVSPNGLVMSATPEELAHLAPLGYKVAPEELLQARAAAQSEEDYFGSVGSKIQAFGEGLLGTVTLGGSDVVSRALGDEESLARSRGAARFNPGYRLAGQLTGGLAYGGGGVLKTAAQGAALGAGAELSEAMLSEDPITAELVTKALKGGAIGFGIGGALGAAGKTLGARAEAAQLSKATAAERTLAAKGASEAYDTFRMNADELGKRLNTPKPPVERPPATYGQNSMAEIRRATDEALTRASLGVKEGGELAPEMLELKRSLDRIKPSRNPTYAKIENHIAAMESAGVALPESVAMARAAGAEARNAYTAAKEANRAAKALARESTSALNRLPSKLSQLANLDAVNAGRIAKAFNAHPELAQGWTSVVDRLGLKDRIRQSNLPEPMSQFVGTPAEEFLLSREVAGALRGKQTAPAAFLDDTDARAIEGIAERGLARAGIRAAMGMHVGAGAAVWPAASIIARLVSGGKASITEHLDRWAGRLAPVLQKGSPSFAGAFVASTQDGLTDEFDKAQSEILESAGRHRERAWQATEPMRQGGLPQLADRVFETLARIDEHLLATMPTTAPGPGEMGKAITGPTREERQTWLDRREVTRDPVGALQHLDTLSPAQTETLRITHPALLEEVRNWVLANLPRLQEQLIHSQMMALSELLDSPVHEALTASYLALSQKHTLMEPAPNGTSPGQPLETPAPPQAGAPVSQGPSAMSEMLSGLTPAQELNM